MFHALKGSYRMMQDELRLIEEAKKNPARFGPLYAHYHEAIFRFVYRRVQDIERTNDLVADTFIKAIRNLGQFENRGQGIGPWLTTIARNEVAQYYRQTQKQRVVALENEGVLKIQEEYQKEYHEELEINIDTLAKVVQQLDEEEVYVLELRFFEKRSFRDIAELTNTNENNAKVRLYRLLERMGKLFKLEAQRSLNR